MNADELEDFYHRVGAAIWHVQYLEDVLVSFLAMKIISPKRSAGQATAAEMDALLAQRRRLTLGPLIQACIGGARTRATRTGREMSLVVTTTARSETR
jgi:hypothetical protein